MARGGLTGLNLGNQLGQRDLRLALSPLDRPRYPADFAALATGENPDTPLVVAARLHDPAHWLPSLVGGQEVTQKLPSALLSDMGGT